MNRGIAVTGMGIISALGNGMKENYRKLAGGKSALTYPEILNTRHKELPVGEIKLTNWELAQLLQLNDGHSFTRAALLGAIAVKEAVQMAGLSSKDLQETGLISATSIGGMDQTEEHFDRFEEEESNRRFIRSQHPGFTTSQIGEYAGLKGFTTTISTACSSSANALMLGARMIKAGKVKRVVVGGTDCLSKFTLNGFNSLMILSPDFCKPFDENRTGLNLGEGAAYLLLEAEEAVGDKTILGRICGYGNANDAFHQTASSETGEGAFLAMKKAMEIAEVAPGEIDYINAHGTATRNNDLSESCAIIRIFDHAVPHFNSTKGYTGHTLAAAGSIEAVFSLLSIQNKEIFPGIGFGTPMQETGLKPSVEFRKKNLKFILSNSFGFGGNCSSLIFSSNER